MRKRVEETLDLLGIADLRHRPLYELSGGQQQRVAIGSVLTAHPRVLVLDEPTSALDPTAAEEVLAAVTRLVHDLGVTVLLAEHRLERVVQYADRVIEVRADGTVARRPARPTCWPHDRGRAARRGAGPAGRLGPAAAVGPRRPPAGRPAARPARRAAGPARRTGPARRPAPAPCCDARNVVVRYGAGGGRAGRRPRSARGRGHRADGPQRLGQVVAAVGGPGLGPPPGRNGRGRRRRSGSPRRRQARNGWSAADARRPGRTWSRRRRATCSTWRPSATNSARPTGESAGATGPAARELLDRLGPGHPDDHAPARPVRGPAAVPGAGHPAAAAPRVVLLDEPTRGLDYAAKRGAHRASSTCWPRGPGRRHRHPRRRVRGGRAPTGWW